MRRSLGPLLLLAIFYLLDPFAATAAPRLVRDLNRGPAADPIPPGAIAISSFGGRTVADRGILYFSAPDPAHGTELWRSNGTAAGTYRLTDICAGRCDSLPQDLHIFQGRIYFSADDGFTGREVWSSDGTPGNERRLRDLCPGPCSFDPGSLRSTGGALFFLDLQGQTQRLWRSDGTRPGTTLVKAVCTLAAAPFNGDCASSLQRLGNRLLFVVNGAERSELWSSDGTPGTSGETVFLSGLTAGGEPRLAGGAVVNGGVALFLTDSALWRTDGTPGGTVKLKEIDDLVPGVIAPSGSFSVVWKGAFYIFISGNAVRSDGTPQGTVRLDFPQLLVENPPVPLRDTLVLHAAQGNLDTLWGMDSGGHAEPIFEIDSAHPAFFTAPVAVGDRAVFQVQSAARPVPELWVTDGTAAGTRRISSGSSAAFELFSTGTTAFYLAGSSQRASQLWRTDGTTAGTFRVRDFGAGPGSSGPLAQAALGNFLVFSAQTSAQTSADTAPLFRSNGTAAGTVRLSDEAEFARGFARAGNRLFFAAQPFDLWWTDGTAAGTARIAAEVAGYEPLAALGRKLLFASGDNGFPFFGSNVELWSSDGASTGLVKDINPFRLQTGFHGICVNDSSFPGPGAVLSSGLFVFPADDGINGRELWASDGTEAGTRLVSDINPQRSSSPPPHACDSRSTTGLPSNPGSFVTFRQGALFAADDGTSGRELWFTDGIGVRRVRDLRPGAPGSAPHDLTVFRGMVYFIASTQGLGEALWRTDGTAAGTVLVDDLRIGALPSWARSLTVAGDRLFFVVTNEATGPELWVSRSQASSTGIVADLRPGTPGSSPQELTAVGKALLFAATDGKRGVEPWRSDGTAAGTVRLGDLDPGRDASSPGPFTRAGNFIFMGAYDPVHGRELWAIPVAEVASP
jgi:ELWxxDGT repeat protein